MLEEPKVMSEGYAYIDNETEEWHLKEDAPEWAKKEFEDFFNRVKSKPDDNDIVTQY